MNIFIAGATGTLGRPLVRTLVAWGHHVTGFTRSPEKQKALEQSGATPAVADVLDSDTSRLEQAVLAAAPDCVVHALTATLKKGPCAPRTWTPPTSSARKERPTCSTQPSQRAPGVSWPSR